MSRPFRFGLNTFGVTSLAGWKELARKAEDQGYSTFSVADHTFTPMAPLAALSLAAAYTSRLRLGTYVLGNDFWHPTLLVREVATIDLLSAGRPENSASAPAGVKATTASGACRVDPPGVRIERLERGAADQAAFQRGTAVVRGEILQHRQPCLAASAGAAAAPADLDRRRRTAHALAGSARSRHRQPQSEDYRATERSISAASPPKPRLEKVGWVREAAGERFDRLELNNPVLMLRSPKTESAPRPSS